METKFEEHQPEENDPEEDEIVIKDFDDVFDFIGGWGPFQVNILMLNSELIYAFLSVASIMEVSKLFVTGFENQMLITYTEPLFIS